MDGGNLKIYKKRVFESFCEYIYVYVYLMEISTGIFIYGCCNWLKL